jgi:hypothetical protein
VKWPPACEDVSPEAEERPQLQAVTKQHREAVTEKISVCGRYSSSAD